MRAEVYCIITLCAAFIQCGLTAQQQFYAVNLDGSVSNVSFTSSVVDVLESSEVDITIPTSCDNPLQCITPQPNGTSALYIPNGNSSLILLEIQNGILRTFNITSPCAFNDFALLSNQFNNRRPLLIACELTDNDRSMSYVHTDNYGTRNTAIQRVPFITAVVSPVIVMIPRPDEGGADHSIVSISNQDDVVTFEVVFAERDISTGSVPCVPERIQRHRASHIFILICGDNHPYLVNFTTTPASFFSLPNSITALASNARYGLVIELSDSTTTNVTIQEILSQPATTRTMQLNTSVIYSVDFAPGDRFAYVATDRAAIFINVDMAALNGDKEFMYAMQVQLCSRCPSVVFLNNNTFVISSSTNGQDVLLKFFYLWPWPPQQLISRTLNKQPRWYWFTPFADFFPTTEAPDGSEKLSDGAIGGITIAAIVIVFVAVGVTVVVIWCWWHISSQDKRKQETVQPKVAAATNSQRGGTNQSGNKTEQMVTGYGIPLTKGRTHSSQEESKPHAVDNFPAEPSSQTKRDDTVPRRDDAIPRRDDTVPRRDNTIPRRDDTLPRRDDTIPRRDDAIPRRDDAIPRRDDIAVSAEKVLEVYTNYYSKLQNILPVKNISSHLVTERIINFKEEQEIQKTAVQSTAALIVLQKIASALEARQTESFYKLLIIMKNHGELCCVQLANQIRGELSENTAASQ